MEGDCFVSVGVLGLSPLPASPDSSGPFPPFLDKLALEARQMTESAAPADVHEDALRALVGRLAAGDQNALGPLYDATSRPVYALVVRILFLAADAEEVTLDIYCQAWRNASRFDPARGDVLGWLLNSARSRAIDRLRSRGASAARREETLEGAVPLPDPAPGPEEASASSQRSRRVRAALALLSDEQREVIELAYFEGLTHAEIAERISIPLGTAKSRIRLALTRLRDSLAPLLAGDLP
jgi:RNA polymerase sigma-70 factor (ECF subfamily)